MRRVEVHGEVFYVPACWTSWRSEFWLFHQRPDASIWVKWRDEPAIPWRCVSPTVMPAERRRA